MKVEYKNVNGVNILKNLKNMVRSTNGEIDSIVLNNEEWNKLEKDVLFGNNVFADGIGEPFIIAGTQYEPVFVYKE